MLHTVRARDLFRMKRAHAMPQFPIHSSPQASLLAGIASMPQDYGFAGWTQDQATCSPNPSGAGVAGTLMLCRVPVPGVQQITNLFMAMVTAGVTLTAAQCFAGVWDGSGVLVGVTADQSAAWAGATGMITMPLAVAGPGQGAPFLVDTPYMYLGYWFNGTTGPLWSKGVINGDPNGAATVPAGTANNVTAQTGLTTQATAPAKLAALTKDGVRKNWWAWN